MSLADYFFWVLCGTAIVLLAAEAVQDPGNFAQTLVFGLTQGAIYSLVALGYTMVYGIIELINFAHGDVFMIGSFVSYAFWTSIGLSLTTSTLGLVGGLLLTLVVAMLVCALLNVMIERVGYRPLRNAPVWRPRRLQRHRPRN